MISYNDYCLPGDYFLNVSNNKLIHIKDYARFLNGHKLYIIFTCIDGSIPNNYIMDIDKLYSVSNTNNNIYIKMNNCYDLYKKINSKSEIFDKYIYQKRTNNQDFVLMLDILSYPTTFDKKFVVYSEKIKDIPHNDYFNCALNFMSLSNFNRIYKKIREE